MPKTASRYGLHKAKANKISSAADLLLNMNRNNSKNRNFTSKASLKQKPYLVGVDAKLPAFRNYKGGVIPIDLCKHDREEYLNHNMLAVGWGIGNSG